MTKDNKTNPSLYIFTADGDQNSLIVGRGYTHKSGKSFTFYINGKRYKAYPPKAKPEAEGESA